MLRIRVNIPNGEVVCCVPLATRKEIVAWHRVCGVVWLERCGINQISGDERHHLLIELDHVSDPISKTRLWENQDGTFVELSLL